MKRMICLLAVLVMCAGIVCPAYATGNDFVPSVSRPEKPGMGNAVLVEKTEDWDDAEHKDDSAGEVVDSCIVISTVKEAKEKTTDISQEERDLLLELHEKISNGTMHPPMPRSNVVLQILDISWEYTGCVQTVHTHEEELKQEETILVADFDLGVEPDVEVTVLVYIDAQWQTVETVTNNGDGTITCEFHDIGPVLFSVPGEEPPTVVTMPVMPEPVEEVGYPLIPLIMLILAFLLFLLLIFLRRKRKKEEEEKERQ